MLVCWRSLGDFIKRGMVSGNFIKRGVLNRSKREEQAAHPILKLTVVLLSLLAMELLLEVLLSSPRADHAALAAAETKQSSPRAFDPAIGRPASSSHQAECGEEGWHTASPTLASQNQEPQVTLEPQGAGSPTSGQSNEDSLRIEVVEPWEWETCKCEPKGPALTNIIPGERHLRCFACAKPRGPP